MASVLLVSVDIGLAPTAPIPMHKVVPGFTLRIWVGAATIDVPNYRDICTLPATGISHVDKNDVVARSQQLSS